MSREPVQSGAKPRPRFYTSKEAHAESLKLHAAYRALCEALIAVEGLPEHHRATLLSHEAILGCGTKLEGDDG